MHKFLVVVAALGVATLGIASPASAANTTIDFETLVGPSYFGEVDSPVELEGATFSGGEVMTAVANLPANQTTVYGTSSYCQGCAPAITIDFTDPVGGFSAQVMNGLTVEVSYTTVSDTGATETHVLAPNLGSGAADFSLDDTGITQVTIQETTPDAMWDFFVDNVSFDVYPTSTEDCKKGGWETYGLFKNQGDCVSYVATKGKNLPQG